MTTREIYFKQMMMTELPMALVNYTYIDENEIIKIGSNISLEFSVNEDIVQENLKKMEDVENMKGFLFWNNSPEGEKFFKENWGVISSCLSKKFFNI
jgi:hypothetical protein